MAELVFAPDPCPVAYVASIAMLQEDVKNLMQNQQVPYFVMAQFAKEGFSSMADLADRWTDKAEARQNAAKDLGFEDTQNGYDAKSSLRASIRLGQAVEAAGVSRTNTVKNLMLEDVPDAKVTLQPGMRSTMEAACARSSGRGIPPLDQQGSDHYLGLQ